MSKKAEKLIELGKQHGWRVQREDDAKPLDGATESYGVAWRLSLLSGRTLVFMARWARSSYSGRWQNLQLKDGKYRVIGLLLPGDDSVNDRLAGMLGRPLEERNWKRVSDLEWWLARPAELVKAEWVKDSLTCVCGLGDGHPDCYCEVCTHGDCVTLIPGDEKEMAYGKDGCEVWPLCGEHVLLYYDGDGEPIGRDDKGNPLVEQTEEATT